MGEKVTTILMKVDLRCDRCYKKIRRVLCKFPEIRDQVYEEKLNVVKITVVSCCPEFIMKKIGSKGGKSIEKMEMMSLDKKKPEEKPKEGGGGEKKKDDQKPKEGGGEKKEEKPKEGGGGGEKKKEGEGEKKKDGGGGGGGGGGDKGKDKGAPEKKEGGGGGGDKGKDKGAPEKKEGGGGDKGKDKGPPEKKDGGEHKLVREAPIPVSGYPSIFPPVYPIQASYPPPYYPHPVYGYEAGHNPGAYPHYHGIMTGYDHFHRVGGTQYAHPYDPYYEENESACTIM